MPVQSDEEMALRWCWSNVSGPKAAVPTALDGTPAVEVEAAVRGVAGPCVAGAIRAPPGCSEFSSRTAAPLAGRVVVLMSGVAVVVEGARIAERMPETDPLETVVALS